MIKNNTSNEIYGSEHKKGCPMRYSEQEYWVPPKDWENKAFGADESDVEEEKSVKYQNWGARGCAHRGHCVGVEERGVLCRNNDFYPKQTRPYPITDLAQGWLAGYMPPEEGNLSSLGTDVNTNARKKESGPIRNASKKLQRKQVFAEPDFREEYFTTSPLIYHSAVQAEMPPELLHSQAIKSWNAKESALKIDNFRLPLDIPEPVPALPKLIITSESKKQLKKNRSTAKKFLGTKWKEAYLESVRNTKKEQVGIILVGPDGPEFYAKVSKSAWNCESQAKKSTSLSAIHSKRLPLQKDLCMANNTADGRGDFFVRHVEKEKVQEVTAASREDPQPNCENTTALEGETKNPVVSTNDYLQRNEANKFEKSETPRNGERSNKTSVEEVPKFSKFKNYHTDQNNLRGVSRSTKEGEKTVYRAKKITKKFGNSIKPSKLANTTDEKLDKVNTWLMSDTCTEQGSARVEKSEIQGVARTCSDHSLQKLKEALPSLEGRSKEEHLGQLKNFIDEYTSYLREKAEKEESLSIHDGSTGVRIEASKLIDVLNYSPQRLSSETTVNMTQTVTDALVATDEDAAKEPSFIRFLRKIREEKFNNFRTCIDELHELVRVMDTVQSLHKPTA